MASLLAKHDDIIVGEYQLLLRTEVFELSGGIFLSVPQVARL